MIEFFTQRNRIQCFNGWTTKSLKRRTRAKRIVFRPLLILLLISQYYWSVFIAQHNAWILLARLLSPEYPYMRGRDTPLSRIFQSEQNRKNPRGSRHSECLPEFDLLGKIAQLSKRSRFGEKKEKDRVQK